MQRGIVRLSEDKETKQNFRKGNKQGKGPEAQKGEALKKPRRAQGMKAERDKEC